MLKMSAARALICINGLIREFRPRRVRKMRPECDCQSGNARIGCGSAPRRIGQLGQPGPMVQHNVPVGVSSEAQQSVTPEDR
jgi:hypothetical protein